MPQVWNPKCYTTHAAFVPALGEPLLDLLAPLPGERLVELGCGEGALTAKLVERGSSVVGVDSSPEPVAAARVRASSPRVMDGARLGFVQEFDAVLGNAALHWMRDADAVLAGICRALRPGGRLLAELSGAGNVVTLSAALQAAPRRRGIEPEPLDPWYFPSADQYRMRLLRAGRRVERIELFSRLTALPGAVDGWLRTFAGSFFVGRARRRARGLSGRGAGGGGTAAAPEEWGLDRRSCAAAAGGTAAAGIAAVKHGARAGRGACRHPTRRR